MNHQKNQSLRSAHRRLTFLATLCTFTATSLIGGSFIFAKYFNEYRLSRSAFDQESQIIGGNVIKNNDLSPIIRRPGIRHDFPPPRESIGIIKMSSSGETLISNIPERLLRSDLDDIVNNIEGSLNKRDSLSGSSVPLEEYSGYFFKIFPSQGSYFLVFSRSSYDRDDLTNDMIYFLIVNILFLLPFAAISSYLVGKILQPIEKNIDEMEAFIHDAGHELKTPLSIASGNLQILRRSQKGSEEIMKAQEAIKHVDELITTLVDLSSLERNREEEKSHFSTIILERLSQFTGLVGDKSLTVHKDIQEDIFLNIATKHAEIIIDNLISNAIKYNKIGGEISIILKGKSFIVSDTGEGMEREHRKRIFERFYRVNHSRQDSHGIGLALVAKICHLYHIKIKVQSTPGAGSSFELTFP